MGSHHSRWMRERALLLRSNPSASRVGRPPPAGDLGGMGIAGRIKHRRFLLLDLSWSQFNRTAPPFPPVRGLIHRVAWQILASVPSAKARGKSREMQEAVHLPRARGQ